MRQVITYSIIISIFGGNFFLLSESWKEILILFAESLWPNGIYLVLSMAFYFTLLRNKLRFWENFTHEFTHLIVAVMLLTKIKHFYVSQANGELVLDYSNKNILISLSPYFFPLIPLAIILILNNGDSFNTIFVACIYGLNIGQNINQIIRFKKEILEYPFIGIPFIILMNLWFGLFILSWCAGKSDTLIHLLKL